MAGLWCESFENMDNNGSGVILLTKYDASRSNASPNAKCSTTFARTGTKSLALTTANSGIVSKALGASGTTFVFGFAYYIPADAFGAGPNGNGLLSAASEEDGTVHLQLGIDATGHFKIYRNTTLLDTAVTAITFDTWYYIEWKGLISDTVGTYEVRVDTVNVLSGTGADTRNGGAGTWNRAALKGSHTGGFAVYFDDWYICDGTGATNNDFLGVKKVGSSIAEADSIATGSNQQWTPSTGTDHGAMVDDAPPNSDTDYNASSTVGQRDTYFVTPVVFSGTTNFIQVNRFLKKTDAGARTTGAVIRSNGTNFDQAAQSPLTTYSYLPLISETDPDTAAAWLSAGINAAQFGEKIVT